MATASLPPAEGELLSFCCLWALGIIIIIKTRYLDSQSLCVGCTVGRGSGPIYGEIKWGGEKRVFCVEMLLDVT